ncbi:MAG: 3-hydroxyacyl-ACP dehydratase FabZ [Deltaproteobacteria bacterium]|nr:3-hydroxyacyl-ACP dehydratase FabZ [Deltaproteobacteria bacterium]
MDINEIMKYLPHRYPFLLVDRIVEIGEEKTVGIKNVTINEPFFQGHFPGHPIMPGVLIIEAMAQVGCIFAFKSMDATSETKVVYFMGIDGARFRKPVVPGDQIRFELELLKRRGPVWRFKGNAFVDGNLVAEAELLATIVDK